MLVIIDADVNETISLCRPAACFYFPIMVIPAFLILATHFIQADIRFIIATIVLDRNVRFCNGTSVVYRFADLKATDLLFPVLTCALELGFYWTSRAFSRSLGVKAIPESVQPHC